MNHALKLTEGEISCPVCTYPGKEKVAVDVVRIYHRGRAVPCRAPEGYEPQQEEKDQLS